MREFHAQMRQCKIDGPPDDWNGAYAIQHPKIRDYYFQIIASNGMGWDHVSVCLRSRDKKFFVERCCTWEEMCYIKKVFFRPDEVVVQYHPAESDYINVHKYVLHLWRPQVEKLPTPQTIMV